MVSYTVPGTNPVQDSVGNDAAALTNQAVTNNTTAATAGGGGGGGAGGGGGGGGGAGGGGSAAVVEIDGASYVAAGSDVVFVAAVSDGTAINSVRWSVTGPDGFTATHDTPRFGFTAPVGGTYLVSVVVVDVRRRTHAVSMTVTAFGDIADDHFAPEILWLAKEGITRGCSARSFCPGDPVTRAQMASFLARALGLDPPEQPAGFEDVDPSSVHAADIEALFAARITTGCSPEPLAFCPGEPVTRAQMAAFLYRARRLIAAASA